ncbi:MAG: cytochrome c oxidase cbb3-type subunit 3 [Lentimonas sp.]|jgi:cytochrome c oxidase cbb3-type subunit 3
MNTGEDKDALPVKQEDLPEGVILRDHVVDGIQEYDQRLPFWWLCILLSMIVFSIVYWLVLDDRSFVGGKNNQLEAKLTELATLRLENSIDVSNDDLFWDMSSHSTFVSAGQATYETNCIACHGKELEGGIGFNLVDAEWVHGAKPANIYVTIDKGVPAKGMQAWGSILGQKRITEVVAYVLSKNNKEQMQATAASEPTVEVAPEGEPSTEK